MKYLKQFLVILIISLMGEVLKYLIPLSVPASIYGMVILFLCLLTGAIKLEQVKDAGKFLIEIMPVVRNLTGWIIPKNLPKLSL